MVDCGEDRAILIEGQLSDALPMEGLAPILHHEVVEREEVGRSDPFHAPTSLPVTAA